MLRHALKEWAVICRALAGGRQAILLRKGGIAETAGEFRVEHTRFWLYPTHVHQQRDGIRLDAAGLLEAAESDRPPPGVVRLEHFADIDGIYHVHDVASVLKLRELHLWSDETARSRFDYRHPGLFVLALRVHRAARATEVIETPAQAGCRSWVELEQNLPTDGAVPVLDDTAFRDVVRELERILQPTAFA